MNEKKGKRLAKKFYDRVSPSYIEQYQKGYNSVNLLRIKHIINKLKESGAKTILDAGCGTCGPMIKLLKEGYKVKGFDFSEGMIKEGKKELKKNGYDPELIHLWDLEKGSGFPDEKFDVVLALGVFPHVINEKKALSYLGKLLKFNGTVFVSFRNYLFAVYTLNKYSVEFFLNHVINFKLLPKNVHDDLMNFYSERFGEDMKSTREVNGRIEYTDILAKFHNPLSIGEELFNPCGFSVVDTHFYHYHALPPVFERKYPELFKKLSTKLEHSSDWKGYLMASAFLIEAKKRG